ncbi:hypothetical protein [Prescottella equi]|uniref:hypothetical protein n=1 Tax=Rhodococcus hoagii TaxID=43767 RepID=UPI002740F2D3|nr:hypothetical protein [Prescottella equi]MDP8016014.1 hypothetical protein [Prescottella equi]
MTTDVVGARRPARVTPAVPRAGGAAMLFSVCLLGYGLLGYLLTAQFNLIDGDGPSRVANAGYTILSRNPHLGAMGFVWNPLPSLVELPLLGFSHWWPELKTLGLAAVIQSALFMAGAAVGVRRIAFDRDVPRLGRWAAVAAFAANPMIVQYGAVGLSEAALIFCVVWSVRFLLLWVQSGAATSLAWSGLALGFGYLARYEALPAVAGGAAFVLLLAVYRACDPSRRGRVSTWRKALPSGVQAAVLFCFPAMGAFLLWTISSWLLTGDALPQFTSQYGNGTQMATAESAGADLLEGKATIDSIAARVFGMEPLLPVVVVAAGWYAFRRRRVDIFAPLAVCGGVLAFQAAAQYTGMTFGWFRFYILVVPMTVIAAMTLWEPLRSREIGGSMRACASSVAASALMVATLVSSIPVTWHSMLDPAIGDQGPQQGLRSMVWPDRYPPQENSLFQAFQDDRNIARWLDNQNLPPSSVLSDTFQSWGIWLASGRPRQFVITSDFDFARALNAPHEFGIRFILVSDPVADGAADAVNRRYPTLWSDGAGLGELQLTVTGPGGQPRWKIYRLDG